MYFGSRLWSGSYCPKSFKTYLLTLAPDLYQVDKILWAGIVILKSWKRPLKITYTGTCFHFVFPKETNTIWALNS